MSEKIINRPVAEELKSSYLNYALSVIISRALPDIRDGLKPVHRRILYVMSISNLAYNRPFRKSAHVVGQVISSYHPHGDAAIYDSLVRMAQDFSLRYPLIDGQGNFGSMDGDPAAAYRYTEARMAKITEELLLDIDKNTVDFANNFDDSKTEPTVLPSAIPNLLINGSSGIAVGMATNIPPHNLREVCDAINLFIDNREVTSTELMNHIKGPDFPTRGIIHGYKGIKQAYETGRGMCKIRGRVSVEEFKKEREAIIITEIPYQVNKAELIKKMAELVKNEVIPGISEIRDESDRKGVRVVVELKRDINTQTVINLLYKHTHLEVTYGFNLLALVGGIPKLLGLKGFIENFVEHRFKVITRRTRFLLQKAEDRKHIVEGFIKIAIPNIDEIVQMIKSSTDTDDARQKLIVRFGFSEKQVNAVLDMRLGRLVNLEVNKLEEEYKELIRLISEYQDILANSSKIYDLIKNDINIIKKNYGDDRRSELMLQEIDILQDEDLIHEETMVISLTKSNYIKRVILSNYRTQNRGGIGIKAISSNREEDQISLMFAASTHDYVMFISDRGKAYYLKSFELPSASRYAKGGHINTVLDLDNDETIQGKLIFSEFDDKSTFVIATQKGTVKRCYIKHFVNAKKKGIYAINLPEDDRVVGVAQIENEGDTVMFFSSNGHAIKTMVSNIRVMGRTATGVRGMQVDPPQNSVIGILRTDSSENILVITSNGIGKKLSYDEFNSKGRGGKGQFFIKTNDKSGPVIAVNSVKENDEFLVITSSSNIIRINENSISKLGRMATGYRIVQLKEDNDRVVAMSSFREL